MTVLGPCEVSWFAALCDDDYEQLGVPNSDLLSSWDHCSRIVETAERLGFDNILLPSGYALGIDSVAFAAGIAGRTSTIRLLVAVRCGEMWVPQLARQMATLDRMLDGRLTVNIISSEMPGENLDGEPRYRRTAETMRVLRSLLNGESVRHEGEFVNLEIDPPRVRTVSGASPLLYFGGLSEPAREVAAREADVYLMWPDTKERIADLIADMTARAARHGRILRFGYRAHVVGAAIRARSLDSESVGVRRQAELRVSSSDDGYVEPHLWTGIGRGRSGCGAAIVGDPAQVLEKLNDYRRMGIDAFILSGYPHRDECKRFGTLVLPHLDHAQLSA